MTGSHAACVGEPSPYPGPNPRHSFTHGAMGVMGAQGAISEHRNKPLAFGESWDFKRKHYVARAAHKLGKHLPDKDHIQRCLSPNIVQAFRAAEAADSNLSPKSSGFWKG